LFAHAAVVAVYDRRSALIERRYSLLCPPRGDF
jgi:hypothetical protein